MFFINIKNNLNLRLQFLIKKLSIQNFKIIYKLEVLLNFLHREKIKIKRATVKRAEQTKSVFSSIYKVKNFPIKKKKKNIAIII